MREFGYLVDLSIGKLFGVGAKLFFYSSGWGFSMLVFAFLVLKIKLWEVLEIKYANSVF